MPTVPQMSCRFTNYELACIVRGDVPADRDARDLAAALLEERGVDVEAEVEN